MRLRRNGFASRALGFKFRNLGPVEQHMYGLQKLYSNRSSCPVHWSQLSRKEPLYAASSLSLTAFGVAVLANAPSRTWFYYGLTWLMQGTSSVFADVIHIGHSSWWHCVDKWLVIVSSCSTMYVLCCVGLELNGFIHCSVRLCICVCCAYLLAFLSYGRAAKAAQAEDAEAYFCWHTRWHFGILSAQTLTAYSQWT